jgi:hypothetical protein
MTKLMACLSLFDRNLKTGEVQRKEVASLLNTLLLIFSLLIGSALVLGNLTDLSKQNDVAFLNKTVFELLDESCENGWDTRFSFGAICVTLNIRKKDAQQCIDSGVYLSDDIRDWQENDDCVILGYVDVTADILWTLVLCMSGVISCLALLYSLFFSDEDGFQFWYRGAWILILAEWFLVVFSIQTLWGGAIDAFSIELGVHQGMRFGLVASYSLTCGALTLTILIVVLLVATNVHSKRKRMKVEKDDSSAVGTVV